MITIDNIANGEPDSFEQKLNNARGWAFNTRQSMRGEIEQISITSAYSGNSRPHNEVRDKLMQSIDDHIRAATRVAVLEALSSEDFFIAMARSASKIGES